MADANKPVGTSVPVGDSRKTVFGDLDKPIFDDSEFGRSMKEYYAAKAKTLEALIAKIKGEAGISSSGSGV